jgi:nucleoside-diphosphate-sugar epimerase
MKRLLIIGCGNTARRIIPLIKDRHRIYALIRNGTQHKWLSAQGVTPIPGDLDDRASLSRLAGLADIVLHLAPPPKTGTKDVHTHHLLAILSRGTPPAQLVYISTSGVYGDCSCARVNETHPPNPQSERAQRRVDAELQIRDWAGRNGVRASILRVPGIYAGDRLPLDRIRVSMPAIVAEEDSYTNHIHADDLVRIIVATLRNGKPNRTYNASDDSEMKMGDYLDAVADAHRLRRPPRITRAEAQRMLPDSLLSFMNESRRLSNERMKKELKVRLRYPAVADLLALIGGS